MDESDDLLMSVEVAIQTDPDPVQEKLEELKDIIRKLRADLAEAKMNNEACEKKRPRANGIPSSTRIKLENSIADSLLEASDEQESFISFEDFQANQDQNFQKIVNESEDFVKSLREHTSEVEDFAGKLIKLGFFEDQIEVVEDLAEKGGSKYWALKSLVKKLEKDQDQMEA